LALSDTENQVHSHSLQIPGKLMACDPPRQYRWWGRSHEPPLSLQAPGSKAPPFCAHTANTSSTATCLYTALVQFWAAAQRSHTQAKTAEWKQWLFCRPKLLVILEAYKQGDSCSLSHVIQL